MRDAPEHVLWGRVEGEYDVDLRVYFGRRDPTDEMLIRAQEELDPRAPRLGPVGVRVGSLHAH